MSTGLQLMLMLFVAGPTAVTQDESLWVYDEADWPELCRTGGQQSPVDLSSSIAEITRYDQPLAFNNSHNKTLVTVIQDRYLTHLQLESPESCVLSGGGLAGEYFLSKISFILGSQHTFEDERPPLEMQLLLFSSQYSTIEEASLSPEGIAGVSVHFLEVEVHNKQLDFWLSAISTHLAIANEDPSELKVVLKQMLPKYLDAFYRYNGSLTTPGCNDTVVWTVMLTPVPITRKQLNRLIGIRWNGRSITNQYRAVQSLSGRPLLVNWPLDSGQQTSTVRSLSLAALVFVGLCSPSVVVLC